MAIQQWWRYFHLEQNDRQTDRPDISLAAYYSHPLLYLFHLLIHSVQMKWTEVQTLECWWMQRSVVGGEREKSEGESREAQFTHMVLVSGPIKGQCGLETNSTFHSLRAFLRHSCPPLKGHFQPFHIWIIHNVQLKYMQENNNGKLEWSLNGGQ